MRPVPESIIERAIHFVRTEQQASVSFLQRRLVLRYYDALDVMNELERRMVVSPARNCGHPRDVLIEPTPPKSPPSPSQA